MQNHVLKIASALTIAAGLTVIAQTAHAGAQITGGWAMVQPDGTVGKSLNVVNVKHTGTGVYVVKFSSDVKDCVPLATIAGSGKKSLIPGYVVVSGTRATDEIRVNTFLTATLLPADFRFNILASC